MEKDALKTLIDINKAIEGSQHENGNDGLCLSLAKQLKGLVSQFKAIQNKRL